MKTGTSHSGKILSGLAYLKQRIKDVIETPRGSLVLSREFGSDFYQLQDRNVDEAFYMAAYVRLADAINNPVNGLDDFKLENMSIEAMGDRAFEISISGQLLNNGQPITIDNIVIQL